MRAVRVAVVDDSGFVRRAISRLLGNDPQVRVVGTAASGEELLTHLAAWRPDVITLDLAMPGMGGLATLDRVMKIRPTPVIILSTHSGRGAPQTIEALHRGAVDFIDKQQYSLMDFDALRRVLVEKILHVAQVRADPAPAEPQAAGEEGETSARTEGFDLVVIGASTGGPTAIQRVLEDLEGQLPSPVAVAQHMPEGFTRAFAERLNAHLPFPVREAGDAEGLVNGTVYVAPAGRHLLIRRRRDRLVTELRPNLPQLSYSPSVDLLFSSACEVCGGRAIGVLLTGMGRDGARGLAELRAAGAYTVAQDEATSVVYGMPGAAVALEAPLAVLPLDAIGDRLRELMAVEVGETAKR